MTERPRELELVVAGDFNIDFLRDGRMERVLGDCGGDSDGGARISCRSLPTATSGIVQGLEDVGIGESREGSAVLDGLHSGIRPPDLSERGPLGPEAQI